MKWFSKSDIEFATKVANKIALQYPPKIEQKLKAEGGKKRLSGVLELVMQDIENYQNTEKMGLIRKARFGNAFRWRLKEIGYSKEFVEALTEGVVTYLAAYRNTLFNSSK